jgi:O-antigen/teichoic acid export membrane protein
MNTIVTRADMLMVGTLLGMEEAARYSVASRLANIPDFILDAARLVIAPLISEYFYRNKLDLVQSQVTKVSQLIFLTVAPFSLAMLLFPVFFLGLFGKSYGSADMILIYLIAGQIANGLSGTVGVLLIMTNLQKEHARIVSVGAVINLILIFGLVKEMGAEGAALATAITIMISNVCMIIVAKRKLRIVSYVRFDRGFLENVKKVVRRCGVAE